MVETGAATGPEEDAARERMIAAGYAVGELELRKVHCNDQEGCEGLAWIDNGFTQCFAEVDGRSARVVSFAPSQKLQPHRHDVDELFDIRGGGDRKRWSALLRTLCSMHISMSVCQYILTHTPPLCISVCQYSSLTPLLYAHQYIRMSVFLTPSSPEGCLISKWPNGDSTDRTQRWMKAGDTLEIAGGVPHALYCDPETGFTFHEVLCTCCMFYFVLSADYSG
jgi:quercetin dioxygenase-like cupin family protein